MVQLVCVRGALSSSSFILQHPTTTNPFEPIRTSLQVGETTTTDLLETCNPGELLHPTNNNSLVEVGHPWGEDTTLSLRLGRTLPRLRLDRVREAPRALRLALSPV